MIYRLTCTCGAVFEVDNRAIGRRFTCSKCRRRGYVDEAALEPIRVHRLKCQCGTSFRVEEKAIGGTFICPRCRRSVRIDRENLTPVRQEEARLPRTRRSSLPVERAEPAAPAPPPLPPSSEGGPPGSDPQPGPSAVAPSLEVAALDLDLPDVVLPLIDPQAPDLRAIAVSGPSETVRAGVEPPGSDSALQEVVQAWPALGVSARTKIVQIVREELDAGRLTEAATDTVTD